MSLKDTVDGINEAAWDRAMATRDYFSIVVEAARRSNAAIQRAKQEADRHVCPGCGGELSGAVDTDGREDATCGSAHCREQWYGEIAERH